MSEFKHTPGPWGLETVTTSCGICHKVGPFPPNREGEKNRHACLYSDYPSPDNAADRELLANARLIAAAPDLLEALDGMLQIYGGNKDWNGLKSSTELDCIEQARAAIAKATGVKV